MILGVTCPSLLNYRNFPNVKNPRPAACGVQPSFPSPSALSAIPTHPLFSANKDHPKGPQRTSKIEQENGRVRFLHVTCVFLLPLCPESGSIQHEPSPHLAGVVGRNPALRPQGAAHLGYNLDKPSSGSKRRGPVSAFPPQAHSPASPSPIATLDFRIGKGGASPPHPLGAGTRA